MIHEKILLADHFESLAGSKATLTAYIPDNTHHTDKNFKRPSVLIIPGGGYVFVAARPAEPVALQFVSAGFNAFTLDYSVALPRYPAQLLEASAAMALIRRKSSEWSAVPDKIAVCGFSAGGHLAASVAAMWQEDFISKTLGTAYGENRPNALILGYPVITGGEFAHRGSFDSLLGEKNTPEMAEYLSLENRVTSLCPPAFIWHTCDDPDVPVKNSLLMADALLKNNIPCEMHIYRTGPHGLSLCTPETALNLPSEFVNRHDASWMSLCTGWLSDIFDFNMK